GTRCGRHPQDGCSRGTDLPPPLRGRVVDCCALGRLLAERTDQTSESYEQGKVCGVHHDLRSRADAGPAAAGAGVALRGGPAHGRSHESADPALFRYVWRGSSESGWSADPHRGSLEIRLQKRKGNRAHPLHRKAAAEYLEHLCSSRVRFLFQRESERGPSPLESGKRTQAWRILQAPDPDVQRLRRSSRQFVHRNGSEEEFLGWLPALGFGSREPILSLDRRVFQPRAVSRTPIPSKGPTFGKHTPLAQTGDLPCQPHPARLPRLGRLARAAGRQSHRNDYSPHGRLHSDLPAHHIVRHPRAETDSTILADRFTADVRPVRLLLWHAASRDLPLARQR